MPAPKSIEDPEEQEVLDTLRVFASHRIPNLRHAKTADDASADCPFCGKQGKFGIHISTTKYSCFVCGAKGNEFTFVRDLWDDSLKTTTKGQYQQLAKEWGLLGTQALEDWGVAKHSLTGEWCIAGYNGQGKVTGLYRWVNLKDTRTGKWHRKLLPSPRLGHHLFGLDQWQPQKPSVLLCEGWRDGLFMYDLALAMAQRSGDGEFFLNDCNIIAVPGTNSFRQDWCHLFAGKMVFIAFDNDYPTVNPKTGKSTVVGGQAGVRRVASMLMGQTKESDKPASVQYLTWGAEAGIGYNRGLPNGTDIRDLLTGAVNA